MEKIRTSKNEYEVEFVAVGNQTVILKSHNPINDDFSDGFLAYSDEVVIDDYSKFNTVYNQIDEYTIELSNDGSVYTEQIVIEPTEEELAEMERQRKIAEIQNQINMIDEQFKLLDYVGIKIATSRATKEDYTDEIALMDKLASEKDLLEKELKIL